MDSVDSGDFKTVVVAGDVVVDWYFWRREADLNFKEHDVHWKYFYGYNVCPQLGGAIHISEMLHIQISEMLHIQISEMLHNDVCHDNLKIRIVDQKPKNINESKHWDNQLNNPNRSIHTNVRLHLFPLGPDSKDKIFRVKDFLGFTTPPKRKNGKNYPDPWPIEPSIDNVAKADFVLIHDMGNGFREEKEIWPKAINGDSDPIIIYYMNLPLFKGPLWDFIMENHTQKLILILDVEDLRRIGAKISRSLSWEKTALEFLWEVKNNQTLDKIRHLSNVIIRFGLEGAIHYRGDEGRGDEGDKIKSRLYFDPTSVEGGFWDSKKYGTMKGVSTIFNASVASKLISASNLNISSEDIEEGIKFGLLKSREFMKKGHGNEKGEPKFFEKIYKELFEPKKEDGKVEDDHIECVDLPLANSTKEDPPFWSILEERTKGDDGNLIKTAMNIVIKGSCALKKYPVGYFQKLVAVDTAEIENFRSIMNVMEGYVNSGKTTGPLSFAVFGNPGSGKSFATKQIANAVDSDTIQYIEFNVSQFTSTKDLSNAFHSIRDISLEGKVPLAFFDEFDCSFKDQPLGWLRYFLVPMQEGKFMDYGSFHPIGKSIFVFAGGVYESFQQFCEKIGIDSNNQKDQKYQSSTTNKFSPEKDIGVNSNNHSPPEKCTDFVSRLRGYVNILGPNKVKDNDNAYIIRRAIILRSLIEQKIPKIITEDKNPDKIKNGTAHIDPNLLIFLIKRVSKYKHGARSMEAILDMSILKGGKYFGIKEENYWGMASLPSKDQLELHIEGLLPLNYQDHLLLKNILGDIFEN